MDDGVLRIAALGDLIVALARAPHAINDIS